MPEEKKKVIVVASKADSDAVKLKLLEMGKQDEVDVLIDPQAVAQEEKNKQEFLNLKNFYGNLLKQSTVLAQLQNSIYPIIEARAAIPPILRGIMRIDELSPIDLNLTNICGRCKQEGYRKVISSSRIFCFNHYQLYLREKGIHATNNPEEPTKAVN